MTSLLLNGFYASTLSTFHWLAIAILGVVAKKMGFVDSKFKSGLSKVVTNIILPFFIFAQIVNNFRSRTSWPRSQRTGGPQWPSRSCW